MPEVDYEMPLDDEEQEWLRVWFVTALGRVRRYTVQYETTVAGKRVPVVRFDNAHGFAHQDLLDRRGHIKRKRPIPGNPTPDDALTMGQRDIQDHWERYRRQFFADES